MAENTENNASQGSSEARLSGKELIQSLKEQLRLEGDFRDILRDSVRELQKSIKQHDTINAKLELYSTSAINIKEVEKEIKNNKIKQYSNSLKLIDAQNKLGGIESEQVKIANTYLTSLEERQKLETDFITKQSDYLSFQNKLQKEKKDELESAQNYINKLEDRRKLEEYIATISKDKNELESLQTYVNKLEEQKKLEQSIINLYKEDKKIDSLENYLEKLKEQKTLEDSIANAAKDKKQLDTLENYLKKTEQQKKLENYIVTLSERKGNNAKKDLAFNQNKLAKLKDELSLQQQSFSEEEKNLISSGNLKDHIFKLTEKTNSITEKDIELQQSKISSLKNEMNLLKDSFSEDEKNLVNKSSLLINIGNLESHISDLVKNKSGNEEKDTEFQKSRLALLKNEISLQEKSFSEEQKNMIAEGDLESHIASLAEKTNATKIKNIQIHENKLAKLKDEIDLQEQSLSEDQKSLINKRNLVKQASDAVNEKEKEVETLQSGLNIQQAEYIQAKKTNELYESNNEKLKKQAEFEKNSKNNAGILGTLIGGLAQKYGIAENVQADMVEQQKKLAAEALATGRNSGTFSDKLSVAKVGLKSLGKNLVDTFKTDPVFKYGAAIGVAALAYKGLEAGLDMVGNAAAKTGNFLAGLSEDSGTVVRGLTSGLSDIARKIPLVGGLLGGLIDGFSALLDLILGVDNMIVKTGRQLNLSAEAARGLYRQFGSISQASGDIYMNGKKYLESQLELTNQLGTTNILSQEILRTNIKLKDFAGLEADTRAKIAESAQITGKSSENTVKSVLSQVVGLRRATGVSFQYQQVLKEVSNLGGYLGLQFAKYPKELTKTYLATKTLGLELKQLDGMASSFLDFESSISKEFEAQLLTGKEINLNKARELFLNNDLAGAAAEIAKYTGDAEGYTKMNRIQQESFAEALGLSRDQMADMLKQQELYSKFQVKNREDLLKQVDLLRKSGNAQEAINKAGSEAAYNDLVRASAQEKLAMFIEKIKQSIVEFIENTNFIEKVEKFINMLSNPETIKGILGTIRDTISTFIKVVGEVLADVIEVGGEIADFFTPFGNTDYSEKAKMVGTKVREGSLEMSQKVAGFGVENKGISVGENAAKEKISSNKSNSADDKNAMSMAKPTVHATIVLEDKSELNLSGKVVRDVVPKTADVDVKTGPIGR